MVIVLLANGFEESEAIVPVDMLRRAEVETVLVGVEGMTVQSSHGVRVEADKPLDQITLEGVELVLVPGGLGGVRGLQNSPAALDLIRRAAQAGIQLAAICAGPTVLAGLGLLEGKEAVCYPGMEGQLTGAQARPGSQVVVSGGVTTAESAGSAFEFGLKLVERLRGREAAQAVAKASCFHGAF